jgi:hypothetical protein
MPRLRTAGLLLSGTLLLTGCASNPPATPTYQLPPRPVRLHEQPLMLPPVTEGPTQFTLIGLTSMDRIVGSHAEWEPKGRYIRVRLVAVNTDHSSVGFDTARQQLVTSDGVVHGVDPQAMLIERQPGQFDLGANVRIEFDLFFDVPRDAEPRTLRVHGGGTLSDTFDTQSADIPLTPGR